MKTMRTKNQITDSIFILFLVVTLMSSCQSNIIEQSIIEKYELKENDSIRIGNGKQDFLPLIQKGYTVMLPEKDFVRGVLIFLEDSGHDKRNKSAKQLYNQAYKNGFAVLSVSTEIPFDFYFSDVSILSAHHQIQEIFAKYNLPNENIFFLGASLVGHRAMKYIEFVSKRDLEFQLNIKGIVICNFTMDWTRKWHQHERDMRLNQIDLGEPKFINYMLETHLNGTPETNPERYHNFSSYSFFDKENRNIKYFKDYSVSVYIEPAIKYKLKNQLRTLYENNATDMVGFLAELELAGNKNTELTVLQPEDNPSVKKNTQSTWDAINKDDLMDWIRMQSK